MCARKQRRRKSKRETEKKDWGDRCRVISTWYAFFIVIKSINSGLDTEGKNTRLSCFMHAYEQTLHRERNDRLVRAHSQKAKEIENKHAHAHARMYARMYACTHSRTYASTHMRTNKHACTHTYQARIHSCRHARLHACTQARAFMQIRTFSRMYTRTYQARVIDCLFQFLLLDVHLWQLPVRCIRPKKKRHQSNHLIGVPFASLSSTLFFWVVVCY